MGGAKGAGLSFMIECLTSLLLSRAAHRAGPGELGDRRRSVPQRLGDRDRSSAAFGDRDKFLREAERLGTAIAGLARADGVDKIMLPGERGDAIRAERESNGHSHPEGHVATYRQGRAGARREAADVSELGR